MCLRTTYNGSDCSMGSCTQKGITTPYIQLLISTPVVVFSRISCVGITGVMRPPLNLPFLHNEGIFYQGSGELQHFKDFVLKRTFIGQTCRFTPKTMNLITSHIVTCLCNIMSVCNMQIYQSAPQSYNIFYSIHAVTRVRSNSRTRDVNEINNWEPCNLFPVV